LFYFNGTGLASVGVTFQNFILHRCIDIRAPVDGVDRGAQRRIHRLLEHFRVGGRQMVKFKNIFCLLFIGLCFAKTCDISADMVGYGLLPSPVRQSVLRMK
jgi:hypothetical protein